MSLSMRMPVISLPILKNFTRKNISFLFLAFILVSSSCTPFHNFTTYFNVVYLAQQHLDIYEDQMQKEQVAQNGAIAAITTHRWLDEEYLARQLYKKRTGLAMPMTSAARASGSSNSNRAIGLVHLDSAIILGRQVLADKKETKYVEDALFIV